MKRLIILSIGVQMLFASQTLFAQETGWDFSLGGGIASENVYVGSNHIYVTPVPDFSASYTRGSFTYSLSLLEGLSVTYMSEHLGLIASVNANYGETRNPKEYRVLGVHVKHRAETRALLEGTSNLDTPTAFTATLAYPTPIGIFAATLTYHPTNVEYNRADLKDETRHGYVYSLQYMIGVPASQRLTLSGLVSVDFMDRNYADTWFTVDQATNTLNSYSASAGLRSTLIGAELKYQVSEHINISLLGASTVLLGDARHSPFTVEKVQRTMMLQTVYRF